VLNIDCDVSDEILEDIKSVDGIIDAKRVAL